MTEAPQILRKHFLDSPPHDVGNDDDNGDDIIESKAWNQPTQNPADDNNSSNFSPAPTTKWFEDELVQAEKALHQVEAAQLLTKKQEEHPNANEPAVDNNLGIDSGSFTLDSKSSSSVNPMDDGNNDQNENKVKRLQNLKAKVHLMSFIHDYHHTLSSASTNQSANPLLSNNPSTAPSFSDVIQLCTQMGLLLLRHPSKAKQQQQKSNTNNKDNDQYIMLYHEVFHKYNGLYKHARAKCILCLRKSLRQSGYPSFNSSATGDDGTDANSIKNQLDEILHRVQSLKNTDITTIMMEVNNNTTTESSLPNCIWNLCLLQILNDSLQDQVLNNKTTTTTTSSRIDVMDELLRPIVERVHYHFLQTQSSSPSSSSSKDMNLRATSSRLDRLPEWLFGYLRGILLLGQHHDNSQKNTDGADGVHGIVVNCVQPMMNFISEKLHTELSVTTVEGEDDDDGVKVSTASTSCFCQQYLWREVFNLIRHVMISRGFFRHPSIVGGNSDKDSTASSRTMTKDGNNTSSGTHQVKNKGVVVTNVPLCNAVEQILRFDALVTDLMKNIQNHQQQHHLLDTLICSDKAIFSWWIQIEKGQALATLHNAYQEQKKQNAKDSPADGGMSKVLFSQLTETILAVCYSIEKKATYISDSRLKLDFINGIEVPLSMEFMEMMHQDAATARNILQQKRKGSTNNIPNDHDLKCNISQWINVITATHAVAGSITNFSSSSADMGRVQTSLDRLCDAMVEEFSSVFVETILLERGKLASYLMQCAHVLMSPSSSSSENALSPGLNEVVHILQVVIGVCRDRMDILESSTADPISLELLQFAPMKIEETVGRRIEETFLEAALDNDMVPNIDKSGAKIFQHDVEVITSFFLGKNLSSSSSTTTTISSGAGETLFGRLKDISFLMTMDGEKFNSLRKALYTLTNDDELDTLESYIDVESFESDETLYDQGQSMLTAHGMKHMKLRDAASVINRRCCQDLM